MYKCKNCKYYNKEVRNSGICTAWGYGKSCHPTYSNCYACDYFDRKNFNNGEEQSRD